MPNHFSLNKLCSLKALRFIVAGGINTIFGYTVFAVLIYLGIEPTLALLASTVLGIIFNYLNFGKTVFNVRRNWFGFFRFLVVYVAIYFINAGLLILLTKGIGLTPYFGQLICLPLNVLVSWFLLNWWVYKKASTCQREN